MRRAPGIARRFALQRWPEFSARQWEHLTVDARKQERPVTVRIEASDHDAGAVEAAAENASRAGVDIDIIQRRLADLTADAGRGLIGCNLPYGVRINADVRRLAAEVADAARRRPAWRIALVKAQAKAALPPPPPATVLRAKSRGNPIEMLVSA